MSSRQQTLKDGSDKIALAFELFDFALDLLRGNLRRRFPTLSNEEIERKVDEWIEKKV